MLARRRAIAMGGEQRASGLDVGQRQTLVITNIAFGGDGVGRVGEFVVFVPFVAVGEEVEVELTEVKRHFAHARLVKVLRQAPARVTPVCRHYGVCGGCQYQHLAYAEQLRLKHKQVADMVQRLGKFSGPVVEPVIGCPRAVGYRNRVMVRSQWNRAEQRLAIGFLRQRSRLVVDIDECVIAEPELNRELQTVRQHPPLRGGLKVVIRQVPEGWVVPRDSFFQNNRFLLPRLVGALRERLRASGANCLVDVYCGVGFLAVELAGDVASFVGVECDRLAIEAARENARARGITNGEFVVGDAAEYLAALLARFEPGRTAVVLDPPRVGCHPGVVRCLRAMRPAQVIYVSCHPATMARDLNALGAEQVYWLAGVQPLDMFPQTQHVECVADLRLGRPGSPVVAGAGVGGGLATASAGQSNLANAV
jgi:tRNA/tmRNA/rRNA uracil-C5-methylase (TrmA/RlmC/RlmD family)